MAWFYRWIKTMNFSEGDPLEFWGFEENLTPLWIWEV